METISRPATSVQFVNFEFDLHTRELRQNGVKLKIRGHPVDVLAILLECPGELVARETLRKRLWPDDTFVDFEQILSDPLLVGAQPSRDVPRKWILWPAIALVAAIMILGYAYVRTPLPALVITHYEQLTLDGRVKYVRGTDGPKIYVESRSRIYQLPISGGTLSEIPFELPPENGPLSMLWDVSPDGSNLLFGNDYLRLEGFKLWVIGALGHPARYIAKANSAAWSPDSKSIVYITMHGDVYTVGTAGGEPRLLLGLDSTATESNPGGSVAWSPDGRTIRFTRPRRSKIWEMTSDGSNFHEFLPGWHQGIKKCCGRWTVDGEFYLFLAAGDLDKGPTFSTLAQIWAVDERRGKLHPPNPEPFLLASGPLKWGPLIPSRDGKKIFAQGVSMRGELDRYNQRSRLFEPYLNGISAEMPDFSRDGKYVAYVSFPDGILWRANRDGSAPLQLISPPFYPRNPRWSPDGTTTLFTDNTEAGIDRIYFVST